MGHELVVLSNILDIDFPLSNLTLNDPFSNIILNLSFNSKEPLCYDTNSGTSSDGRHLASGRLIGPRDETLPSIVLMDAHDEQA
jgi:hypothetical protein